MRFPGAAPKQGGVLKPNDWIDPMNKFVAVLALAAFATTGAFAQAKKDEKAAAPAAAASAAKADAKKDDKKAAAPAAAASAKK